MIVDIHPQNFQSALIDASMKKPIVIYFHAPRCRVSGHDSAGGSAGRPGQSPGDPGQWT